jgi:anti-sigma-K factor RskA
MSVEDSPMGPGLCGENAAPYVLGALAEEEHEAFCRHLDSCAVCREEVAALQVVASVLPAIAPQLSAPQELKRHVMASVREDARREEELGHHMIAATRTRFVRRSQPAWPRWRPLLAAGALATVVAVLAIAIASGGGAAGTRVIRAEATPLGADASLHVSDGRAQLDVSGLPQTPPQRVYEVWVKRSGAPKPTDALFTVTAHGDATVGVPGNVSGVKVIMVTSEPLGGSKVPTSSPVIVARL